MALNHEIPNDNLVKLVCSSCHNYLSIFPIFLTNDNSGAFCGRCTPINRDDFIRNVAYEAVAEFLQFPCCYQKRGCKEKLPPHRLEMHEPRCLFRKFKCPSRSSTKCEWLGLRTDLIKHFKETHLDLLLKTSEFKVDLNTSVEEHLLLPFENELFVIRKDFDARKKIISCSVERFAAKFNSDRYNYVLKLLNDNKNFWCKLPEKAVDGDTVTVNEDYIQQKLNNPASIVVQVEIVKANKKKGEHSIEKSVDIKKNVDLNWELLSELECPVCYVIMSSKIYQCTSGHIICKECKVAVQNCPLCREDIKNTRNYALEKLISFLTYPCKFRIAGCTYTSKCREIKSHEESCAFGGPVECPLKETENCQMKINKSYIVDHFEQNHNSLILKSNIITSFFEVDHSSKCHYLIKFSEKMFLLLHKYENRKFYWTVQLLDYVEDCNKFRFDIDVIDNSKRKLRCYLTAFCVSIQEKTDFADPHKYIMLTYEQLQPMMTTTLDCWISIVRE